MRTAHAQDSIVRMRIRGAASEMQTFHIGIPALYNVYNAAAVVCACAAMRLPAEKAAEAPADPSGSFGRMESFDLDGLRVQMILVKNPVGCSQALRYLCSVREPFAAAFFLNDLDADGHDISWIWDVDYEKLCGLKNLRRIYVGGLRAGDMALRLKYAGVSESRIHLISGKEDPVRRIRKSRIPVFVLPNYTAMVPLRDRLAERSGKKKYWEEL